MNFKKYMVLVMCMMIPLSAQQSANLFNDEQQSNQNMIAQSPQDVVFMQEDNGSQEQATALVNGVFKNTEELIAAQDGRQVDLQAIKKSFVADLAKLQAYGDVSMLQDTVQRVIDIIALDMNIENQEAQVVLQGMFDRVEQPTMIHHAAAVVLISLKTALITPIAVSLGGAVGSVVAGSLAGITGVVGGAALGFVTPDLMVANQGDHMIAKVGKIFVNNLTRVLVGVVSVPALTVIGTLVLPFIGTLVGASFGVVASNLEVFYTVALRNKDSENFKELLKKLPESLLNLLNKGVDYTVPNSFSTESKNEIKEIINSAKSPVDSGAKLVDKKLGPNENHISQNYQQPRSAYNRESSEFKYGLDGHSGQGIGSLGHGSIGI